MVVQSANVQRRILGSVGAFVVGALITLQGVCNRALGRYLDGSYQHAGFISLFVSTSIFLLLAALRRLLRPAFRHFGIELQPLNIRGVFAEASMWERLKFLCSGVPGACFVVVFAMTINMVTSAVAGPVGIAGILGVSVALNWNTSRRVRWLIATGSLLMVGAMFLVSISAISSPIQEASVVRVASMLTLSFLLGLGVGWQLLVLRDMRIRSSSALSAAIVSSLSGLTTTMLVVLAMIPFGWSLFPQRSLAELLTAVLTTSRGFGGVSGFGLIYLGAIAAAALAAEYKSKLGSAVYLSILGFGMLTAGLFFGFSLAAPLEIIVLQAIGYVIAVVAIYLCVYMVGRLKQQSESVATE